MSSDVTLHPVLDYFYQKFINDFPEAKGMVVEETTEEPVAKAYNLGSSFFVCNSTIKWEIEKRIKITGSRLSSSYMKAGSSLLAGRVVQLKTEEIIFTGTEKYPVIIVALEDFSVHATEGATIKNLIVYLLKGAKFSFHFASTGECENITLWRMKEEGEDLIFYKMTHWKTTEDLYEFAEKKELAKQKEEGEK